jgi:hypothetical protein
MADREQHLNASDNAAERGPVAASLTSRPSGRLPFSRGVFSAYPRCPRCFEGHDTDRWHRPRRPWRKVEHYSCKCHVCGAKWKEATPDD